jgi:hypothetical protein
MPQFRKKPVVIEARQFTRTSADSVAAWSGGRYAMTDIGDLIEIDTLEGTMTAHERDWIIQGVNGEFYPCKPDIFEKTYEPVED